MTTTVPNSLLTLDAPLGDTNVIINGAMEIDQRNSGAAVTPVSTGYSIVDRFSVSITQSSKLTFQQVADAPVGFVSSLKVTVASQYSPLAADVFRFVQAVEGSNIIGFAFGSAAAASVTLSFWVKGSVAGTYSIALQSGASVRAYVGTVTVTTSWAKQTVTLTGDTTGTWATNNSKGLELTFDLGSGSNYNTTAGSWQGANYYRTAGSVTFVNQTAGATLNITGVKLEPGTVATPWVRRSYGAELALCQRYYQALPAYQVNSYGAAGANIGNPVFFPAMRTTPTVVQTNAGASNCGTTTANTAVTPSSFTALRIITALGVVFFSESATVSAEL